MKVGWDQNGLFITFNWITHANSHFCANLLIQIQLQTVYVWLAKLHIHYPDKL